MKPLKDGDVVPLSFVMSRRQFCRAATVGAAALVLPACGGDALPRVGTGTLEDPNGDVPPDPGTDPADMSVSSGSHDMAHSSSPDLAHGTPDLATGGGGGNACPSNAIDTGQRAANVAVGTAVFVAAASAFICRDSSGWFAVANRCGHEGKSMNWTGSQFHCPSHGANFKLDGSVINGPFITFALAHYTLCTTGSGSVGISKTTVAATQRYSL